jgi:hypothetical protein
LPLRVNSLDGLAVGIFNLLGSSFFSSIQPAARLCEKSNDAEDSEETGHRHRDTSGNGNMPLIFNLLDPARDERAVLQSLSGCGR